MSPPIVSSWVPSEVAIATGRPSSSSSRSISASRSLARSHGIFSSTATACGEVGELVIDQPAPSMCSFPPWSATAASHNNNCTSMSATPRTLRGPSGGRGQEEAPE